MPCRRRASRQDFEVVDRAELGVDRVVAAVGRRRSPTASRGRPGRRSASCCGPCGSSCRSGGSAAGRARRSRARRGAGSCSSTPLRPPKLAREQLVPGAEARALAVDLERQRARQPRGRWRSALRSTAANSSGPSAASCLAAPPVLQRVERVLEQPGPRRPGCASACPRAAATPSESSPARSCWPATILRSSSSRQVPNRSVQASIVDSQRPIASTGNSPAQRTPSTCVSIACSGASCQRRAPGACSGRPRADCRGRRGRCRPRPRRVSPTQRLAG